MNKRIHMSFPAFYLMWAEQMGWEVPDFHLRICLFLEKRGRRAVLRVFRGAAKSTLVALYQAWKLREDPQWRFIDRAADDSTAIMLSADTKNVLLKHPACKGMTKGKLGVEKFNVVDNLDARNASVKAHGILSNVTGSRANEMVNDDTEVPKNIKTPETRESLRLKLGDETHILVPGGNILYIGTPHTHNSLYDEKIDEGYEHLTIPLFSNNTRHPGDGERVEFTFDFKVCDLNDLYVMVGRKCLDLSEYKVGAGIITLQTPPEHEVVVDIYGGNVWPKRFNRAEINFKREECKTQNEWDSQYLLMAKPIHKVRLNPDHIMPYDSAPEIIEANGAVSMTINGIQIVNSRACWDCSLGKKDSDESIFSVIFTDGMGRLYWEVLDVLKGDVFRQCKQIRERVEEYQIPGVTIKTAGIGGFLPPVLRKELSENRVRCGISEEVETINKANRILSAFEPPLSGRFLYANRRVLDGGLKEQMRDWKPISSSQPDDKLDAGAGCIQNLPVTIGKLVAEHRQPDRPFRDWRPHSGSFDIELDI